MKYGIHTLDDFDVKGKTVLLRVDINEPVDRDNDVLHDITRIEKCVPTIVELSVRGAKLVILAHQGSDIEYHSYYYLKPHADVISNLIGRAVTFVPDVCGPYAREQIKAMRNGDILLLDNVRFMAEEMTLFELKLNLTPEQQAKTQVVEKLAPLADLYVCDAFAASHRSQPTLVGLEQRLPSAMGRLFEKEYSVLSELLEKPEKPLVFVLGGAKIQDAFPMMEKALLDGIVDKVLAGGLVANVMLAAKGVNIGAPSFEFIMKNNLGEFIERSKGLLSRYHDNIILPVDLAYARDERVTVNVNALPVDDELLTDIGPETVRMFEEEIRNAKTVFVNGPMGIFEKPLTEYGTKKIWAALAATSAFTVLGGGDSIAATNKYKLAEKMGYICTGGGAMVRFLSGDELPVVTALKSAVNRYI